ncbi:MAG: polynucleotide adenylyltransferase PcnB [Planctomycetota bacterium]|jgi:poly(A) polymerase|nr:polynucleotide adenylyltransferase PcnB [Planctomycetota bacterium]
MIDDNHSVSAGEADDNAGFPVPSVDSGPPPLIRAREDHNISRRDIDPDALRVLYRLSRGGFVAYLVGGGVRDLLLGRKPKDFDISTNARPEQIRAMFKNCILIGRRFRLAHIRFGDKAIETSTFRSTPAAAGDPADPGADLFQRDDNLFGTPREDALRRDFTVNGIFYDIATFSVIDYVGGTEDLAERRIRAIGDPNIRFREDPVRMIRAVRFASRLNFHIASGTDEAIRRHGAELAKAAPARLLEEICRLFAFSSGERAVRLLDATGLLGVILPEVAETLAGEDGGEAARQNLWSLLRALDSGDTVLPEATPGIIFSVLLLEPLKRHLNRDWSAEHFPRLRFEKVHSFLEPLAQRLRLPRKLTDRLVHIYLSQNRFANPELKPESLANFVVRDSFHESLALAEILAAAEGAPRDRLDSWRDMLAERVYSREDGAAGEGAAPPQPGAGEGGPDADGETSAPRPDGQKRLSRSARRRRGRRNQRPRETPGNQPDPSADRITEEAVPAESPAPANPAAGNGGSEAAETKEPARPPEAAGTTAEGGKSRRRRRHRGGRRRRDPERTEETPSDSAPSTPSQADGPKLEEGARPLTAASFYVRTDSGGDAAPAGPDQPERRTAGRRGKGSGEKAGGAHPAGLDPDGRNGPLRRRRDPETEAEEPTHWLDEI